MTEQIIDKKDKYYVYQSNKLIQSSQNFSLVERRIIYHILSKVNPDSPQRDFEIKVSDFMADFKDIMNEDSVYNQLKEAADKLFLRHIIYKDEDKNETIKIHWFSYQKYQDTQATLNFRFTEEIMPFVFNLRENGPFTKLLFKNFKRLTSVYALRLYELFGFTVYKNNTGMDKKNYVEVTVDDLRFFLDCQNTYPAFKAFKQWVIEPALKEIFSNSLDLYAEAEYIRQGRKIHKIKFHLYKKSDGIDVKTEAKVKEPVIARNLNVPPEEYKLELKKHPNPEDYFNNDDKGLRKKLQNDATVCNFMAGRYEWALENLHRISKYRKELLKAGQEASASGKKKMEKEQDYNNIITKCHEFFKDRFYKDGEDILNNIREKLSKKYSN